MRNVQASDESVAAAALGLAKKKLVQRKRAEQSSGPQQRQSGTREKKAARKQQLFDAFSGLSSLLHSSVSDSTDARNVRSAPKQTQRNATQCSSASQGNDQNQESANQSAARATHCALPPPAQIARCQRERAQTTRQRDCTLCSARNASKASQPVFE